MPSVDTLFINGHILTQNFRNPTASQLGLKGNKIVVVGVDLSMYRAQATRIIDLKGAVMTPGFLDVHTHFLEGGQNLLSVQLRPASSKDEFIEILRNFAVKTPHDTWITGGWWDQQQFPDKAWPRKEWIDAAAPDHFVFVSRHDGHCAVANSKTLALAGITKTTDNPTGGMIVRDSTGEPTGLLKDAAMGLVFRHQPASTPEEDWRYLEAAMNEALRNGITSINDMCYNFDRLRWYEELAKAGKLKVRIRAYAPLLRWDDLKRELDVGFYQDKWFQIGGLKGFSDGSLGSATALMFEDYDNEPGNHGLLDKDFENLAKVREILWDADAHNIQVVIHAIGDKANRLVLDLFAELYEARGKRDRRFRIEHAQHIHPDDQHRFGDQRVVASIQPFHCVDDSRWADALLGDRSRYAFPYRSIHKHGGRLAMGSDWPVAPLNALLGMQSAILRNGWTMAERLDLGTVLHAHTEGAAFAEFSDHYKGHLSPGMLADFVVLKREFLNLGEMDLKEADLIQAVFSDGKLVYGEI
ncbi:MAG: amidohydrolase [Candidatus Marinimicrobia bacterium]|nr:amidohydrolase [Candidatus Neomarinimicrobiota bacterium]